MKKNFLTIAIALALLTYASPVFAGEIRTILTSHSQASCDGAIDQNAGTYYEREDAPSASSESVFLAFETLPYPSGFTDNPENFCYNMAFGDMPPSGGASGSYSPHSYSSGTWHVGSQTSSFVTSNTINNGSRITQLRSGSNAATFEKMYCEDTYVAPSCTETTYFHTYSSSVCTGGTRVFYASGTDDNPLNVNSCQSYGATCCTAFSRRYMDRFGEYHQESTFEAYSGTTSLSPASSAYSATKQITTEQCTGGNTTSCSPLTADLTAGSVTPTTAAVGTPVTFSSIITNLTSMIGSATPYIPTSFEIQGGSIIAGSAPTSIGANASLPITGSPYTFTSPGTYQVRARADLGVSGESYLVENNESNNYGAWTTVTVSDGNQCTDGSDNDSDGRIDANDYGCSLGVGVTESPNPQCSDGLDNDGNGYTDFSGGDPLCSSHTDNSEFITDSEQPGLTLTAQPARVQPTKTSTITWSATNVQADSCRMEALGSNDDWGAVAASGSRATIPLTSRVIYTLACRNLSNIQVSTSVTVSTVPTVKEE